MSQTYRVRVKDQASELAKVSNKRKVKVKTLGLLDPKDMGKLVAEELEKEGWGRKDGKVSKQFGEVGMTYDPETEVLDIDSEAEEEVQAEVDGEFSGYSYRDDEGEGERKAREKAASELKSKLEEKKNEKEQELRDGLEKRTKEDTEKGTSEVKNSVKRANRRALELKARMLGEVESVDENESGEVRIRVKV